MKHSPKTVFALRRAIWNEARRAIKRALPIHRQYVYRPHNADVAVWHGRWVRPEIHLVRVLILDAIDRAECGTGRTPPRPLPSKKGKRRRG